jgi:hypothetical protein
MVGLAFVLGQASLALVFFNVGPTFMVGRVFL